MTIDKKEVITLSKWKVVVFAPLIVSVLFGGITGYAASRYQDGKLINQVENNVKQLDNKVDKDSFEIVRQQLDRIEEKIDNHLIN